MPTPDHPLIIAARQHVKNIFTEMISKDFVFHSLDHTREVAKYSEEIAAHNQLGEEDYLALILASWFHDTGYSGGTKNLHEEESQVIATRFLKEHMVDQHVIDKVNGCIMATKMPQTPTTLIEQIICDADLFHLGTQDFDKKNKLLREEINNFHNDKITKEIWRKINIEFLTRHRYFTDYAREKLEPVKQIHLRMLVEKQASKEKTASVKPASEPANTTGQAATANTGAPIKDKATEKSERARESKTERGVVAMFRIMSENHINLSQMADSKANIMISVNTIVISIMVSVLLGKLQFYPEFIVPTIILVGVCLAAVVYAILATRPNISEGTFTREDIKNKKVNLLFFGNFFRMELADYDWAMKEMMVDNDYLYSSMIKDIYFLGVVLARKYKFLRISYNIFMFGLVAAIIAFGIAFIFADQQS